MKSFRVKIYANWADGIGVKQTLLPKEKGLGMGRSYHQEGQALSVTELPGPYLTSVHVMQGIPRRFVVIRFKATDVSSSEVGCAEHLKKNSALVPGQPGDWHSPLIRFGVKTSSQQDGPFEKSKQTHPWCTNCHVNVLPHTICKIY